MEQTKENFKVSFDFVKTPITQIADYIIISASKHNTSDIHFDPRESGMMVRFRIDGDLQDYSFIPKAYERNLTTRLKLLANMNITESRLPQDGAIKGMFGDTYLDMRVSCLPLNEGEKIVIRILDYTRSLQGIDSLGFHPDNLVKLKRMMTAPNGIILVTGATGSGKSTTTYSILQGLNNPETNIITVEDPIEMNIQGINQVQVNSEIGMTFAAALRSILRQDPNVILIGEIRDSETAQIAVRSAITGHLVLSTIHTNNALSTIERLLDMDVERYLLSTALTGIIAQRLAKGICPRCRFQRKTTPYEKKIFRRFLKLDVKTIWDANPNGCEYCRRGYKGRIAIQEVLEIDDDIRSALTMDKLSKEELAAMVYTERTITMLQDALIKCLNGETNFEEVYRAIEMQNEEGDDYKSELTAAIDEAFNPKDEEVETVDVVEAQPEAELPNIIDNLNDVAPADMNLAPPEIVGEYIGNAFNRNIEDNNNEVVQIEENSNADEVYDESSSYGEGEEKTEILELEHLSEEPVTEISFDDVQTMINENPIITMTTTGDDDGPIYDIPTEDMSNILVSDDNIVLNDGLDTYGPQDNMTPLEQFAYGDNPINDLSNEDMSNVLVSDDNITLTDGDTPQFVNTSTTEYGDNPINDLSNEDMSNVLVSDNNIVLNDGATPNIVVPEEYGTNPINDLSKEDMSSVLVSDDQIVLPNTDTIVVGDNNVYETPQMEVIEDKRLPIGEESVDPNGKILEASDNIITPPEFVQQ